MKWILRTKSYILDISTSTYQELIAACCLSTLGLAIAFWQGALISASLLGGGGGAWVLSRYKRTPQTMLDEQGRPIKVRLYLISDPTWRHTSRIGGISLVIAGIIVLLFSIIIGSIRTTQHRKRATEQINNIETNIIDANNSLFILSTKLTPIVDDYIYRLRREEARNTDLNTQLQTLAAERDQLESALLARAAAELAKGKGVNQILTELRTGHPRDLLSFLDQQVEYDDARLKADRMTLIARHRERATIAFPLGEIAKAEQSLIHILDLAPDDPDALIRLGDLNKLQGNLTEAQQLFTRVLDNTTDDGWRARALGCLGLIEDIYGNLEAAEDYHKRSLAIETKLGNKEGIAADLANLGLLERKRGNLDAAEKYLSESLLLYTKLGYDTSTSSVLVNLGLIEWSRGNLELATNYLSRALTTFEKLDQKAHIAATLGNLGTIDLTKGDLDAAESHIERSLAISEELGRKEGVATQCGNLGVIERMRGNLDAARTHYMRSLAIHEEYGNKEGIANQLGNLGVIEKSQGNLNVAAEYFERALVILSELGSKEGMGITLCNLGAIEQKHGDLLGACEFWRRALTLFEQAGAQPRIETVRSWLTDAGCPDQPEG